MTVQPTDSVDGKTTPIVARVRCTPSDESPGVDGDGPSSSALHDPARQLEPRSQPELWRQRARDALIEAQHVIVGP